MARTILHSYCCNSQTTTPPPPPPPPPLLKQVKIKKLHNSVIARRLSALTESKQMNEAFSMFQSTKKPDTFIWNVMIRGYTNCMMFEEAIDLYHQMQASNIRSDHFTIPFVIKSCTQLSAFDEGLKIHGKLFKVGLDSDIFISNSLIAMYSKMGLMDSAERVFREMGVRDAVTWNLMIDGLVSNGDECKSLSYFKKMQEDYFQERPDRFAIMSILEASSSMVALELGKEIHCYIIRNGLDTDIKLRNSLLDMYCKCGDMGYAEILFASLMILKNVIAWNIMICGYALNSQPEKAVDCLINMQADNIEPDTITMVNLLPACGQLRSISNTKRIHGAAIRKGLVPQLALETALVDVYAKCKELILSELVFNQMPEKSLVSWNTMITAYVKNSKNIKALRLFLRLILKEGPLKPNDFTIASIIPAYAELASLRQGKQIHGYGVKLGYGMNTFILNSIIHMYAKCGDLEASRSAFDRISVKGIASWNSIIMGYGIHGLGKSALNIFSDMKDVGGLKPDKCTFVSVLSACSISGQIHDGWKYFDAMQKEFGIEPQIEHYGCMVDLLGRAGELLKAKDFIEKMHLVPNARIWGALLTASRNNNNIQVAEFAAERIFDIDHDNSGCYVLLSNMYADMARWEDVEKMRSLMKEQGLEQTTGKSLVELNSKTSSFVNGDRSHVESSVIHHVLKIISRQIGEDDVGPLGKETAPTRHSVRLAITYGLISSTVGSPVLVKKNVRVCVSCHNAIKLISTYTKREIIVGDSRIYHHFKDGLCTCGDYW